MEKLLSLASVGLAYDGIGVTILGFAFFSKSIKSMMIESGTYWGGNNALLESLIQARTDGVTGTSFLVAGFFLQWLGSLGVANKPTGITLLFILVFIILLYVSFLRDKLISMQVAKGEAMRRAQREKS